MSLLDRSPGFEPCNIYMEITTTDADGNTVTKASTTPIPATARFQIQNQSGTSSRLAEQNNEGYESEKVYSMRLPRAWEAEHGELQMQAKVGWGLDSQGREAIYEIFGDVLKVGVAPRTRHNVYNLVRY